MATEHASTLNWVRKTTHHVLCAVAFSIRAALLVVFIAGVLVAVGITGYQIYRTVVEFGLLHVIVCALAVVAAGAAILAILGWAFWMRDRCE